MKSELTDIDLAAIRERNALSCGGRQHDSDPDIPWCSDEECRVCRADAAALEDRDALLSHIAALQQQADAGAEALRVVAAIEKLSPVMISRLPVRMTYKVESLSGIATIQTTEADTLLAALEQAVAAKGVEHG